MVEVAREPETSIEPPRPKSRRSRVVAGVVLLLLLVLLPLSRPVVGPTFHYLMQMATIALMWVTLATSWNLIGGYAGYISLGRSF